MDRFGLLGRKLEHSYSPRIHASLGDYSYEIFELEPEELKAFIQKGAFKGLNVTIPYKEDVMRLCDHIDPLAKRIGAVNTLLRKEDGLYGFNTDYCGFQAVLRECGQSVRGKRVLIFGTGGASKTVKVLMEDMDAADVVVVGRRTTPGYDDLSSCYGFDILINATPVGMYPNNGARLLDISRFAGLEAVFDMIYNPWRTDLLLQARKRGISYCNGLPMLVAQAAESAAIFTGIRMSLEEREKIIRDLLAEKVNLCLIGMPGCGKSEIGRRLSEISGRELVDIDECVEREAGMSVPEIFERLGEAEFRRMEKEQLAKAGKGGGRIIATGGGAVMDEDNRRAIAGNSYTVYIARKLSELSITGRPLSGDGSGLRAMFRERLPYYKLCADYTINNDASPEETAERIWGEFCAGIGD